jgi:hypothetical protein
MKNPLRKLLEGVDTSQCIPGKFWEKDGSPCCPIAKALGPIEARDELVVDCEEVSKRIQQVKRIDINWSYIQVFTDTFDIYMNDGYGVEDSLKEALRKTDVYFAAKDPESRGPDTGPELPEEEG